MAALDCLEENFFFFPLLCETMLFAARITAIKNGPERKSGKKVLFYLHTGLTQLWLGVDIFGEEIGRRRSRRISRTVVRKRLNF